MGESTSEGESLTLCVDNRGRNSIPKRVRERLGTEPNAEIPAYLLGSVSMVNPKPSENLQTATAGRDDWEGRHRATRRLTVRLRAGELEPSMEELPEG